MFDHRGLPRWTRGWLFDLYPSPRGITLWLIDEEGNKHCCWDDFVPSFFLALNPPDMRRAEVLARSCPIPVSTERAKRKELFSGDTWDVLQINVRDTTHWREAVWYFEKFFPHFAFFNSDIPPAQLYLYHTQLFPLAFGEYRIGENGRLLEWTLHDRIEAFEYRIPPLAIMSLRNANDFLPAGQAGVPPKYQRTLQLELSYDGSAYSLEQETPLDLLEAFNWHLHRFDPDIIVTEYGDATIMPKLQSLAQRYRVPLLLNRDRSVGFFTSKESSFFQYGKVIHKDGAFQLAGRWHVDVDNSFTVVESDLDGLFEMARLTRLPPQHQARAAIGTGLSSLQLAWAYHNGFLVPSKKREPEEFKTAATLMLADRGGLIFQPPVGYHEDVAELDFVSMYPTIMVRHNVSPETINCRCCERTRNAVPELGYRICDKREGIVPATLRPVIEKRAYYKKMKKELKAKGDPRWVSYDRRQNALKWMLVTCFGYLGYKNARFGRIEAHESVNAFSRDAILTAKEIAEARGFRLLHAIIDCMWLKKPGATERDYEDLCCEVAARTDIDISLEGIYNWILFPASKTDPLMPTANRYVGWYKHGELKVRGIEVRRRDTPKFVKKMQEAMLDVLKDAQNVREVEALVPDMLAAAEPFLTLLRSGKANPMELVIRKNISQEAEEYTNNSVNANVAKALKDVGISLAAGERIEFILVDSTGKRDPQKAKPLALYAFEDGYDIEKYTEFALKAVETLVGPWGWDEERLKTRLRVQGLGKRKKLPCKLQFSRESILADLYIRTLQIVSPPYTGRL
jgi:DNA polymerase-2